MQEQNITADREENFSLTERLKACMSMNLKFRITKDIDMLLVIENLLKNLGK